MLVALAHARYRNLAGGALFVDLHQDFFGDIYIGHFGERGGALHRGRIAQLMQLRIPVALLVQVHGMVDEVLHKLALLLDHLVLRAEVDAGVAQRTVLIDEGGDLARLPDARAVGAGVLVRAHAAADARLRVDIQLAVGEPARVQNFQPVLQVRAVGFLLRQGVRPVQRIFLHDLPEPVDELGFFFLVQFQRLLEAVVRLDQVVQLGQRNVGGAYAGAVVAPGAHKKAQGFDLRNRFTPGDAHGRLATGDGRGQPVQAEHVAGGADPLATVALGARRRKLFDAVALGFERRRHHQRQHHAGAAPQQLAQVPQRKPVLAGLAAMQQLHARAHKNRRHRLEQPQKHAPSGGIDKFGLINQRLRIVLALQGEQPRPEFGAFALLQAFQEGQVPQSGSVRPTAVVHRGLRHERHQTEIHFVPRPLDVRQNNRLQQHFAIVDQMRFGFDRIAGPVADGLLDKRQVMREILDGQNGFAHQHRWAKGLHFHRQIAVLPQLVRQVHRQPAVGQVLIAAALVHRAEHGDAQRFFVILARVELQHHHMLHLTQRVDEVLLLLQVVQLLLIVPLERHLQPFLHFIRLNRMRGAQVFGIEIHHAGGTQPPFAQFLHELLHAIHIAEREGVRLAHIGQPFDFQNHAGNHAELALAAEEQIEVVVAGAQNAPLAIGGEQQNRLHGVADVTVFKHAETDAAGGHPAANGAGVGVGDILLQSKAVITQVFAHAGEYRARPHGDGLAVGIQFVEIEIGQIENDVFVHRHGPAERPGARAADGVANSFLMRIAHKFLQIIQCAGTHHKPGFDIDQRLFQPFRNERRAGIVVIDFLLHGHQCKDFRRETQKRTQIPEMRVRRGGGFLRELIFEIFQKQVHRLPLKTHTITGAEIE